MTWWKKESDRGTDAGADMQNDDSPVTAEDNTSDCADETTAPVMMQAETAESQPSTTEPEAENDDTERLGIVIAVGNQKGGVGKTTNTVHLAAAFGLRGYKCLVVDLDPAAGATKHLGISPTDYAGSLELLTGKETVESLVVTENMPRGVHLIPSRPQLSELDTMLSKFVDKMKLLSTPLEKAREMYDFILLDTPPIAAATPTLAAYAAAEWFLLTAFAHPLSLGGLSEAFNDIADVRQFQNPELTVLGVIFSNVDTRAKTLRGRIEAVIDEVLPGRRFDTWISQAVIVPDCSGKGITVFQLPRYDRIKVARQYIALSHEIEERVKNRDAFRAATEGAARSA